METATKAARQAPAINPTIEVGMYVGDLGTDSDARGIVLAVTPHQCIIAVDPDCEVEGPEWTIQADNVGIIGRHAEAPTEVERDGIFDTIEKTPPEVHEPLQLALRVMALTVQIAATLHGDSHPADERQRIEEMLAQAEKLQQSTWQHAGVVARYASGWRVPAEL